MDKYTLHSRIGEGSYGVVYKITNGKKKYALKIEKEKGSLHNEIKVLLSLRHPHIPALLDYGISNGCSYIVMPLLHASLSQIRFITLSFFTRDSIARIGKSLVSTLNYIHRQGYVYRDLKPENMMIGFNGKVYLVDFGMCVHYVHNGRHIKKSRSKLFIGTLRYASINTHRGIVQSRRDDLESLGYVLVYLLLGKLPWCQAECSNRLLVQEMKKGIDNSALCKPLNGAAHWARYFSYVKALRFDEKPNYHLLYECLASTSNNSTSAIIATEDPISKFSLWSFVKKTFCC